MSLTGWVTLGNVVTLSEIEAGGDTYVYFDLPVDGEYQNELEYEGYYDG